MNESLSVIISAHNAQATLSRQVVEFLEILPELTADFELLIFDNGSHDGTEEIACDLELCYPQVRCLRFENQVDSDSVLQAGMSHSRGETVIYFDDQTVSSAETIHHLWQHCRDESIEQYEALSQPALDSLSWIERLMAWGRSLRDSSASHRGLGRVKVIRRPASSHGLTFVGSSHVGNISRTDPVTSGISAKSRPNFIEQVKQFTFDE